MKLLYFKKQVLFLHCLLCLVASFCFSLPAYAQHRLELGAASGLGFGRLYNALPAANGGFTYGQAPIFGIHGGVKLIDELEAVGEINYTRIRTTNEKFDGTNAGQERQVSYRLDYIELPLLLRRYLGHEARQPLRFYFCFGPYASKLLLSGQEYPDSSVSLRSFDTGLGYGGGATFWLRGVHLWIDGRYNMGLLNIQRYPPGMLKTDLLSIRAGASFIFP